MSGLADALDNAGQPHPPAPRIDLTSTEVRIRGYVTDKPIERASDWEPVFRRFNLDPDAFEIIDDTVRMSSWDQSKRTEDGDRDIVPLYSYAATFRRVTEDRIPAHVLDSWRDALRADPHSPANYVAPAGAPTYAVFVADPQLGKKGTAEARENWRRGIRAHMAEVKRLGDHVGAVHVAFMGDETENVVNNYTNQPHTVELNRSAQLHLDADLRIWSIREALRTGKRVTASSVISNHGEWTRNGDKDPVTTRNDNASTYVAREVKRLFDELTPYTGQRIEWTIGDTHPGIVVTLSGVKCYLTHGYVEKGRGGNVEIKTRAAIERQILGRTEDLGDVRLWFAAHYHHAYYSTFEGRTLFGLPALEAERSSEYMLDQFGVWSRPGLLGLLIGEGVGPDGWRNVNVW